jgi:hypothetical protein
MAIGPSLVEQLEPGAEFQLRVFIVGNLLQLLHSSAGDCLIDCYRYVKGARPELHPIARGSQP